MITAHALSRSFNGQPAVEDLTFTVPEGKLFVLLGPNGAGKTTTVRMLLGLIAPTSGSANVAGFELGGGARSHTNNELRAVCGLLTESPGFYERVSGWENLEFFAQLYRIPAAGRAAHLERLLRSMGLWERRDDLVGTYSKGMKQKLAIIRSVFHSPRIIFLDEPTSGLDPEASLMVREMIVRLKSEGRTIVVCTHNLAEAERLADLVGIIRRRLLVFDSLDNLHTGAAGSAHVEVELAAVWPVEPAVLAQLPFVRKLGERDLVYTFAVDDAKSNTPRLVQAMAAADARILAVRPRARDLESVYLECVRDSGSQA